MPRKAVSSIIIALDSVCLCIFASPIATSRHLLKKKENCLLGLVKLYQIHRLAVYCIRNYINSSCFTDVTRETCWFSYFRNKIIGLHEIHKMFPFRAINQ